MAKIQNVFAKEILDSLGVPTLEVTVVLNDETQAIASVPSGTSKGKHEAVELRDGDANRYRGQGVLKAVAQVNEEIAPRIRGLEAVKQKQLDETLIQLDGTPQKQRLGANAILGVSMAVARAAATSGGFELYEYLNLLIGRPTMGMPTPLINVIEGGKHAQGGPQFQEFQLIPVGFQSFADRYTASEKVVGALNRLVQQRNLSLGWGMEGGIVPRLTESADILKLLSDALAIAGYSDKQFSFGIDLAASNFYRGNRYQLDGREFSDDKLIEYLEQLTQQFPVILLEDPLAEDDWFGWQKISERLADVKLLGDDLFVSSVERLKEGIRQKVANAIVIKPNQVGTLTEVFETIKRAASVNYAVVASHRAGETKDSFLADFAVAIGAWGVKAGAFNQPERMAKYERLLEIEKIRSSKHEIRNKFK